jgi:hypothetical protein
MRNPDNCKVEYCGYGNPKTFEEIEFELLGLQNLIKKAEERISMLKQSRYLADLAIKENKETLEQYFNQNEDK